MAQQREQASKLLPEVSQYEFLLNLFLQVYRSTSKVAENSIWEWVLLSQHPMGSGDKNRDLHVSYSNNWARIEAPNNIKISIF